MPIYDNGIKYYTIKEVATLLDLTVGSITKFVSGKKLNSQIVASRRTFTEDQLKDFLLSRFTLEAPSLSLKGETNV